MHVHGNNSDLYASGPAFQQHPPATSLPPPPPPHHHHHHGPFAPQNPAIQQGHPYFHPTSGLSAYHHGPPAPVASSVVGSPQPYLSHTQHPNVGNQISHSYPPSEQRVWSQNVRQLPPTAPLPGPSAYPLSFPQGLTLGRGQSNQYISHGPLPGPPLLPPYSSSSSSLTASPFGSTALGQHSYRQTVGPQPPPPPPPPSSPPQIPPLPTSSPPSNVPSNNDGTCSLKDLLDESNLILEHPFQDKHTEDRNVEQSQISGHHTENNGPKMESMDAVVAHSPAASDMEMEDDITHPDVAKEDLLSTNSNGGCTSISQEDFLKEQLQVLQHTREHKVSEDALHENLSFAEASAFKDQRGAGSEVMSHCDFPITEKVSSEADQSGMTKNEETEQPFEDSENDSSPQHKISSQPSVLVVCEETGCGKLSGQLMEGANAFNLLQCYASDNISGNEGESLSADVSSPAPDGGSTNFDAQEECSMGLKVRVDSLSASNKHTHPKSMIASPRNAMEADKFSPPVGIVEEFSDTSRRGHESITTSAALRSKDPSRSYDVSIDLEVAKFHKQDRKIDPPELRVDQFGRLVREGVSDSDSDSDASDSPRYTRRHARRSRKRSSSRSRSRSPHDRRRRSTWRRNGRRGRSRSLSPKRRRSRSRSPVLRRDTEFNGDKQRWEKSQLPECFDFLRGKCYRGSTCRYFHHETDMSEKLRYNRGNQQSTLRIPNVHEGEVLYDKEANDEGLPQDMPVLREVRDAKELPVGSTTHYPDKLNSLVSVSLPVAEVGASNLSDYSAHDMPSSKENTLVLESPAQNSDKMSQIVDQQGRRMVDSLVSESSLLVQASSAHLPGDRPDPEQRRTSQLLSVESPITKPCSTEECQSQSLKELAASVPSQFTLPLPSVSQTTSAPFGQDYNSVPPIARFQSTLENLSPYQAPVSYQHSPFLWPSSSLPSTYLPHPPPPPPHHFSVNVTLGEHDNPPQHSQQSLQPPWDGLPSHTSMRAQPTELPNRSQTYQYQFPLPREPDHMLHTTENFASDSSHMSNLSSLQSGRHIIGESVTGHPVQGMNPLQSYSQGQHYSLRTTSPSKAVHGSLGGGLPSDSSSSHIQPYFQKASYNLQYSAAGGVSAQYAQPEKMSSSMSRLTPDFLEKNQPSYVHTNVMGSRIPNRFNPYASTFDLPLSSKFKLNASIQENDTTFKTKYGASVGSSSVHVDGHNVTDVISKYMISSSSSQSILPRPGGDQYDPLFDSIEPASTLFSRDDHKKHETPGDSDNMHKFSGSGRVLNEEITKPEGGPDLSGNDSMENEEFGETAEAEIGDVSNGSPSNPNDATNLNTGEIEIDQVKGSREKRKGKDSSSMKLFKISVASFVKDVLKPSWRQGNMSKEAFKTIVKKTVDKVHGAMKGHRVPKSQAKINHYIDSSRGKLTKLVMGYVDKYVKV